MLDFAVLGLLMERPRHGYELRRALGELGFWRVSFGSLYPALRRLEKRGAIQTTRTSARRRTYEVTTEGRRVFDSLIQSNPDAAETDRGFQIRLAFLGHLPPQRRIQIMDNRRRELSTQLKTAREILITARSTDKNEDRYRIALMEHSMHSTEADVAWLDGLVAVERSASASR